MTIQSIVDRSLRIEINDPQLAEAMESLNHVKDNVIDDQDFNGQTKEFQSEVVRILIQEKYIKPEQGLAAIKFFNLYNKIQSLDRIVRDWQVHHDDFFGDELEFEQPYWDENVAPQLLNHGALTLQDDYAGLGLARDLYDVYTILGGYVEEDNHLLHDRNFWPIFGSKTDEGKTYGVSYNTEKFPAIFADKLIEMGALYMSDGGIFNFLHGYDQIECDTFWKYCNVGKEFDLYVLELAQNRWETIPLISQPPETHHDDLGCGTQEGFELLPGG